MSYKLDQLDLVKVEIYPYEPVHVVITYEVTIADVKVGHLTMYRDSGEYKVKSFQDYPYVEYLRDKALISIGKLLSKVTMRNLLDSDFDKYGKVGQL